MPRLLLDLVVAVNLIVRHALKAFGFCKELTNGRRRDYSFYFMPILNSWAFLGANSKNWRAVRDGPGKPSPEGDGQPVWVLTTRCYSIGDRILSAENYFRFQERKFESSNSVQWANFCWEEVFSYSQDAYPLFERIYVNLQVPD
jgi:hypothetical protein